MTKDHTILCNTGFIMTGDTLSRLTERGGIIFYVGFSPSTLKKSEMPQRTITFGKRVNISPSV